MSEPTAASRLRRERLGAVVAAGVGVLGLAELGRSLVEARRTPRVEAFIEAGPALDAMRPPGAAVVVAPSWLEPVARQGLGEARMPLRDVARADETGHRQLVELSARGARSEELRGWREVARREVGPGLEARVLSNPRPVRVVRDFVDAVDAGEAAVRWEAGGQTAECPWRTDQAVVAPGLFGAPALPARRYACGPAPWQSVAVTVQEDERYRARRCVWSHPPVSGGSLQIGFPAAPLGQRLRGHAGLHWTLERERRGAPVFVEVWVADELMGTVRHDDGQGWAAFELPLGRHAGTSAAVAVRVRSPDASERHFCWQLDSRSDEP